MSTAKELNARLIGVDAAGAPYKVLVVDDEMIIRNLMKRVLLSAGFKVVGEGKNGLEALQLYKELQPDLMTLDVMMPRMDGLQALKEIRKDDKKIKIVMLTSETDKHLVTDIIGSGATDYIVKPIDRKVILQKMVRVLKG